MLLFCLYYKHYSDRVVNYEYGWPVTVAAKASSGVRYLEIGTQVTYVQIVQVLAKRYDVYVVRFG